jgi:hypothetical protein
VEYHNRKLTQFLKISKQEKLCLVFLGWEQMNGRKVKMEDLIKMGFGKRLVDGMLKKDHISYEFRPIRDGRKFFYQVVHQVCLFFLKYPGLKKTKDSLNVNLKNVKEIIL